ncbi:MAG: FliI/YscN family ATPase [Planctomycetales bacterium]|nr:FliI/YscN family ATPase [Planctomycetales bacterium]
MTTTFDHLSQRLETIVASGLTGSVAGTDGAAITVVDFAAPVGAVCEIERVGCRPLVGEVIGSREHAAIVFPRGDLSGVRRGAAVRLRRSSRLIPVGRGLLGRVLDAEGKPLDDRPQPITGRRRPLVQPPPAACERPPIDQPLCTGVRAIDGLLTCGRGQRVGLFSGSGVGKSTLLGMMARHTSADVNVVALIGERGREVNEFLQRDLSPEALARTVVVVSTSDEPALARVQAALAATTIAEHFRDEGADVLLLMDSLTRFATAQRELALAAGEPAAARGFPPSVFAALPRLVERAGRSACGSITAFYTVLVDGDDLDEPISDAVRGLLDGHVVLSRKLAARGHWPAIDVLNSVSRLAPTLTDREHQASAMRLRALMSARREHDDLISIGAYRSGSQPDVDEALAKQSGIESFLTQPIDQRATLGVSRQMLLELSAR